MTNATKTKAGDGGRLDEIRRGRDALMWRISALGLLALFFQAGILVAIVELPPTGVFRDAVRALGAVRARAAIMDEEFPRSLWQPVRSGVGAGGVVRHDPSNTFDGVTLYTSGAEASALLVDMQGRELHRWDVPFSAVWPPTSQGSRRMEDRFVFMRRAVVEPDGDLIALYETPADTPNGRGVAKLDRSGNVLWRYDGRAHHDLAVDADGTIHVLAHRLTTVPGVGPFIEDLVVTLDADGTPVEELSVLEMLLDSPFCRTGLTFEDTQGDATHTNTVHVIGPEFAKHHAGVSAGDLMICLRNLNLVLVVNREQRAIVWGTTGPWNRPHDPDPLPNGHVLIFDNYVLNGTSHGSRVLEFDPRGDRIVWAFDGANLRSDVRSCQQALPNGNVLITESDGGRLLEVTRGGDVVWEFVTPTRGGGGKGRPAVLPIVCGARRYTRDELPFLTE